MRPQSAKSKGRRLQQFVRDTVLATFTELEPDDVRSTSMGASGTDLLLSPAAKKKFPFAVECKNQESLSIWASLGQAAKNVSKGLFPLLVFRRNHSKTYVALELQVFMQLLAGKSHEEIHSLLASPTPTSASEGTIQPDPEA